MERKTTVTAEDGRQDVVVTRDFNLPLSLLFRAYSEAALLGQWMGTKVVVLDNRNHGSYRFETTDPEGNLHVFHGMIHEFSPGERIVRTFEMDNTPFPAQLEFLEFESLTDATSRLTMQIVYRSVADRTAMLKLPFAWGINMAHDRIEEILGTPQTTQR